MDLEVFVGLESGTLIHCLECPKYGCTEAPVAIRVDVLPCGGRWFYHAGNPNPLAYDCRDCKPLRRPRNPITTRCALSYTHKYAHTPPTAGYNFYNSTFPPYPGKAGWAGQKITGKTIYIVNPTEAPEPAHACFEEGPGQ